MGIEYGSLVVSPSIAKEILQNNTKNRAVNKDVVKKYALDMADGLWEEDNPQGSLIVLGKDGILKDGQHRLLAVIEANKSIKFMLSRVDNSISHFDEHRARNIAHYLQIGGMDRSLANNETCAVAKLILSKGNSNKIGQLSSSVVKEFIEKNSINLMKARQMSRIGSQNPLCKYAPIVAAIFSAIEAGELDEKIERFCEVANSGFASSDKESIAIVARNELQNSKNTGILRSSIADRWNVYGIFQEYIHLFAKGSIRKRRITTPTFYYSREKENK